MSLIGAVEGVLEQAGPEFAYIRVGGILLEIAVPSRDLQQLGDLGTEVRLWTQLIVREDDLQLYGFVVEEDKRLFQALIGVSGVGPKVALGVQSVLKAETLAVAIAENDVEAITRAPGVGRRTAERIILDLKTKIQEDFVQLLGKVIDQPNSGQQEAIHALVALGYSRQEAGQVVSAEIEQSLSVEERVRRALQRIGR
ncbi:uncharacterized protein METZ01_LOCUS452344 [marine metagenome]|uniref:DNA helicase Holliday junction RuvA type domain-containing protein n=1 Tax=marine metagenome TaxID=408172 RepID=A0A382ZW47_9ZZZZ